MKTEAQLDRTDLELWALDSAYAEMQFRPEHDTLKRHLQALESKLVEAHDRGEFWQANPDHRIG